MHHLVADGAQSHLHPLGLGIPNGDMSKILWIDVAPKLTVDNSQHVPVKGSRHALMVIVGRDQPLGVLDQIHAQQQGISRFHHPSQGRKEARPRERRKVADGAAKKGDEPALGVRKLVQMSLEVADQPVNLNGWVAVAHQTRGRHDRGLTHIERHVAAEGAGCRQSIKQEDRFACRS